MDVLPKPNNITQTQVNQDGLSKKIPHRNTMRDKTKMNHKTKTHNLLFVQFDCQSFRLTRRNKLPCTRSKSYHDC